MTRQTELPVDSFDALGSDDRQTSGEWLISQMQQRRLSNSALWQRLQRCGYSAGSINIISAWKSNSQAIGTEVVPLLLTALGMPAEEASRWAWHFLYARHPRITTLAAGASRP